MLIHGTPSFSYAWRKVLPKLTGAGFRPYLFDLLGYGHSERPLDPLVDTSVSAQVPILLELLDHWGLERVDIVGTDIGGAIAMRLGVFHPERVRSLTIIDTVSYDSWPSPRTRRQIADGLDAIREAPEDRHRVHFAEWLRTAVREGETMPEATLEAYLAMISGPIGQASLVQHQMRHYDARHTMEIVGRLHELGAMPVQFIWGADDAWQHVDYGRRLNADVPGSVLHVLEDCGHFALEDQPERIAELIEGFLPRES
ncbi:hypothetical protein N177_1198 [Lutibaculum baratangense AMV1]|uniref:AB hydrolase-1 domain-containing protein n=1 Tax=Lutibaculum baratangense AMV1 TaxID=631454 RepID=V4TIR0_9HYPH|nr:hypothetical protein N177_1198 [Lutibaculum baratangense AMV1]